MDPVIAVLAGVLGAVVGSFLNVVIHRVPRGGSLVRPASSCPACGAPIRPADNIPILSWLVLRGRCRACRAPISARYPLVEAATAALFIASAARFDDLEAAAFVALAGSVLIALAAIDLAHRRLPNVIVLPATGSGLGWLVGVAAATGGWGRLAEAAAAAAAAFAVFFVIAFVSGGMGFGDVKLAGFVGLATGRFGWEVTVLAVMAAFVLGGLVAVGLLLARRVGRKQAIPFGPWLAAGAVAALFAGPGPVRAWLGL